MVSGATTSLKDTATLSSSSYVSLSVDLPSCSMISDQSKLLLTRISRIYGITTTIRCLFFMQYLQNNHYSINIDMGESIAFELSKYNART